MSERFGMGFDVESFRSTGVEVVKDFFEDPIRERLAELGRVIVASVDSGKVTRSAQFTAGLDVDEEAQVSDSAALQAVAREVLGPEVCWLMSRVLMKDRTFTSSIEVHQDWPYFGGDTRKLNVFIPLTRCRRENGMIMFFKGSHTLGPVERGAIDADRYPQFEPLMPDIDVGDVLFADFLTWHSSVPAEVDDPRILLQVALQPVADRSSNMVFGGGWEDLGVVLPRRSVPMLNAVPSIGLRFGRELLDSGRIEEAEAVARGLLIDSETNVEALLLQRDIAIAKGEDGAAFVSEARTALSRLEDRIGPKMDAGGPSNEAATEPVDSPPPPPQPSYNDAGLFARLARRLKSPR